MIKNQIQVLKCFMNYKQVLSFKTMYNNVAPTGIFTYKHIFLLADGQARQWGELKVETCQKLFINLSKIFDTIRTYFGHYLGVWTLFLSHSTDVQIMSNLLDTFTS